MVGFPGSLLLGSVRGCRWEHRHLETIWWRFEETGSAIGSGGRSGYWAAAVQLSPPSPMGPPARRLLLLAVPNPSVTTINEFKGAWRQR